MTLKAFLVSLSLTGLFTALSPSQDGVPTHIRVTHGPILGKPTPTSKTIWARTQRPGDVRIFFGETESKLTETAPLLTTQQDHDNTGTVTTFSESEFIPQSGREEKWPGERGFARAGSPIFLVMRLQNG